MIEKKNLLRRLSVCVAATLLLTLLTVVLPDKTSKTLFAQERLTLVRAIELALEHNYAIKISKTVALQAENNAEGLRGLGNAGVLPNVNLIGAFSEAYSEATQRLRSGDSAVIRERRGYADRINAVIQLDWTLFNGMRMFATLDRLKALQEGSRYDVRQQVEGTVAQVMNSYYNIVQQQTLLRALQNALAVSRERLEVAESRQRIGAGSQLEILRAKVDLNADSAAVLRQITTVRNAKATLQTLLAKRADDASIDRMVIQDSITLSLPKRISYQSLIANLETTNAALLDARNTQNVSAAAIREAQAAYYPTVNFGANYSYANTLRDEVNPILLGSFANGWSFNVNAQFTIFNGFDTDRIVQNAQLEAQNAELSYNDLKNRLENSIAQSLRLYDNSIALMTLEEQSIALARETERLGVERFKLGSITSLELREIQLNVLRAETRLATAQFEAKAAEIELLRLTGKIVQ